MEFYFVLAAATAGIAALAAVLWLRTRHVGFPIGIGLFYYWSLYGAWSVIIDRTGGESGKRYDYLNVKMFPIELDTDYLTALIYYALFIMVLAMTVLLRLGPMREVAAAGMSRIHVSHAAILALALLSCLGSYLIMRDQLQQAADMGMSAYIATRGGLGEMHPLFTVHQVLNRLAIFSLAIGCAVYLSGPSTKWISSMAGVGTAWLYAGASLIVFFYLAMLGNKNELLAALILGGLVYIANSHRVKWALGALLGSLAFGAIATIDFLRGLPVLDLWNRVNWWEALMWVPEIRSSNEAFGAHFSLYGVLHYNAELTYGSSLIALLSSVIPRLYWPERPEAIYIHYAESLGMREGVGGQGYSIHHATGWYLNFGWWGLLMGAVILGLVWAWCYNASRTVEPGDRDWRSVLALMAPAGFVSFIPPLVRAGPEAYKGMVIEAFFIPTVIVLFASMRWDTIWHAISGTLRAAPPASREHTER